MLLLKLGPYQGFIIGVPKYCVLPAIPLLLIYFAVVKVWPQSPSDSIGQVE